MRTATVVWIIVVILMILGLAWKFTGTSHIPAAISIPPGTSPTTTPAAIPGDNLALGQDSSPTIGAYLIAYNGMTLYTYVPDTNGVSNCADTCAASWPPYIVTSKSGLVAESPIKGSVGTLARADGSLQLTYDGKPLYFYIGDAVSGETSGQGIGNVWFAAKP